jgi:hypothetical protein
MKLTCLDRVIGWYRLTSFKSTFSASLIKVHEVRVKQNKNEKGKIILIQFQIKIKIIKILPPVNIYNVFFIFIINNNTEL